MATSCKFCFCILLRYDSEEGRLKIVLQDPDTVCYVDG